MDANHKAEDAVPPPVTDEAELDVLLTEESAVDLVSCDDPDPPLDTAEQQGLVPDEASLEPPSTAEPENARPARPVLWRQVPGREVPPPSPAPLHLPPPAPPTPSVALLEAGLASDSLSLSQLRSLVDTVPATEPTPYAFTYDDASSFEEELEEWFSYSVEEQAILLKTYTSFSAVWETIIGGKYEDGGSEWTALSQEQQKEFMKVLLEDSKDQGLPTRLDTIEALVYVLLGCWHESAGTTQGHKQQDSGGQEGADRGDTLRFSRYSQAGVQVDLIRRNVRLFIDCGGLRSLVEGIPDLLARTIGEESQSATCQEIKDAGRRELWCVMTALYAVLEVARIEEKEKGDLFIRNDIISLPKPGLFMLLIGVIDKMRWDDSVDISMTKVFLLAWKTILVTFGGLVEVEKAKRSFADQNLEAADARGQPIITASPLDYHLFRQEISSKYPAYNPPPPLFPLEPENRSILPPLKNHPNRVAGNHVFGSGLGELNENNTSIFQQPVHIATPAPSPPPSPAGPGGKGGKKQNYQTNQMFPFLYPPLDEESNKLGGKGSTDLQDLLVGRKWEGSDIPTSILEAAELFAKRMRASRAMKQLWEERVNYMKYERGWTGGDDAPDVGELSLEPKAGEAQKERPQPGSMEERLELVEECYGQALPYLQSLVIVMMRVFLYHVTALLVPTSSANALQSGYQYQPSQGGQSGNGPQTNGLNGHAGGLNPNDEITDKMRTQEILDKAVCGMLLLLLKWFKISHVLKFEYLTQLLVDTSYTTLILKMLQMVEIEKAVVSRTEQEELNFFHFCRTHSRHGITDEQQQPLQADEPDMDDAVPPPIPLRRAESGPEPTSLPDHVALPQNVPPPIPEVDELGNPLSDLPQEPITDYSWRTFFTYINALRIMQKISKHKAHRNLMLINYKSSQFLRKCLKVPQPLLRLYTLKLFKNQVPYCGKKWRQSNMRVITAVYLHCRPELRDDWLAGASVDHEVDMAVPLEQALRSLTHWHNVMRYKEVMGATGELVERERDFFRRELDKMDWGVGVEEGVDGEAEGWGEGQVDGW
ncbi:N1221-domain-containing protein [Westerdykella ornata]|uniref:N1221-domain-containing protein n=1 Tax=Westerdykella ornata TaxID=318751 RepID=A0A6A6J8D9_WESOR|nr:N1221-domain-containing protein [Westerdykella ornata]KAF2271906.1 N1221-domain-containing protein [Westerdykella ornata]